MSHWRTLALDFTLLLRWLCLLQVHVTRRAGEGLGHLSKAATEQFCFLQVVDLPVTFSPFGMSTTSSLTCAHVPTLVSCCNAWLVQRQVIVMTWSHAPPAASDGELIVYSSCKGFIMLLHNLSATSMCFLFRWLFVIVVWFTLQLSVIIFSRASSAPRQLPEFRSQQVKRGNVHYLYLQPIAFNLIKACG